MLAIKAGQRDHIGYAWLDDRGQPQVICARPRNNHHEALGVLMMSLSCTEDLRRHSIDLESVDKVPDRIVELVEQEAERYCKSVQ